jgi:hypothetical protein
MLVGRSSMACVQSASGVTYCRHQVIWPLSMLQPLQLVHHPHTPAAADWPGASKGAPQALQPPPPVEPTAAHGWPRIEAQLLKLRYSCNLIPGPLAAAPACSSNTLMISRGRGAWPAWSVLTTCLLPAHASTGAAPVLRSNRGILASSFLLTACLACSCKTPGSRSNEAPTG